MQSVTTKGAGAGLRERKKQATRAALSEAAVRLAAEHGAENVTVEAISNAAGVSPRTFFNYFDSHDDAFVMMDTQIGERIRRAVRDAPAELSPLEAVREAMAAELADVEQRHEVWSLRAKVLQKSPHLLARGLGLHMAEERDLARTIAHRLDPGGGSRSGPGAVGDTAESGDSCPDADIGLYPRLLAAVAGTAVRVSVEHWYAQSPTAAFPDIFRDVFTHLSAGLRRPSAQTDDGPSDRRSTES
ncbi:TetR/AcrR family transcriptional regulator [Streptomyces sp. NP-1717]|uniref:TetR/AcrR family transcriptional regulator n=1 Tax=unclassified Streptomyces TaxID=2593676 RepID=UPI001F5D4F7C|nr:TetR/AcrR family transcriptional regulator [Streptomyces sp. NP-1717]MCI3222899.1 TetR family transcriptional regulator [Streptomyces sp. NP-1717]WTA77823.1 TetR/AcrR family transcriptional regulator [Streptomyces sp. NBC_00838]